MANLANHYFLKFVFAFLPCFLFSETAFSQQSIALHEALQLAKQNNLKLLQQKENERVALLEEHVQKSQRLPSLDLSVNSSYFSEVNEIDLSQTIGIPGRRVQLGGHDRSELLLSVRQPIFTGFRLQSQVDLARNTTLSEQAKFEILSNEVYHQVYLLFYRSQNLANQRKILEASLKRLHIQLQNVRNLFEAAQVMAFDTLQVYNQMLTIKIELQDILLSNRLVNLQMARLLDLPDVRQIDEVDLKRPSRAPATLMQQKAEAIQKRPELNSIRIAQRGAEIQQKLARSTFFPSVFAHGNFHYAKPGLDPVANEWMDYFSVGVSLQWNLWRWQGDRKKVAEFQVIANRLSLEERELLKAVEYEVEESFENLNFSLQQLRLAQELRDQQSERYRIVSVQHQNGLASTNDLVTAETDLTRAELRTQQALVQYYIFLADLRKATGTMDENL